MSKKELKEKLVEQQQVIDKKVVKILNIKAELKMTHEQLKREKEEKLEVLKEVQELEKEIEELSNIKKLMVITCKRDFEDEVTNKVRRGLENLKLDGLYDVLVLPDVVTSVDVP